MKTCCKLLAVSVALVVLAGCRAEEQNRPTSYSPGVYQGKKDQPLDEATRQALRERGSLGH